MDKRKNLPKTALHRIYWIDSQIASGRYPNSVQLSKEYEISKSTIDRDIDYMRVMLNAPIEYSALHRGYYYSEKTFRLPGQYATANDMLALGMAKSILRLYKDTPFYESAKQLLDEITAPLSATDSAKTKKPWFENRIVVPPIPSTPVKPELWQVFIDGLRDNRIISIEYKGRDDNDYKTCLVRPYQLIFQEGIWYLYGKSNDRKNAHTFSLLGIKNAALTNETFMLPYDYDFLSKHDGNFFNAYTYDFKIWFSEQASLYIDEYKWSADQSIEKTKDNNGKILSFKSSQLNKVLWWVLSFGKEAIPLKPIYLVEMWKQGIKKT